MAFFTEFHSHFQTSIPNYYWYLGRCLTLKLFILFILHFRYYGKFKFKTKR